MNMVPESHLEFSKKGDKPRPTRKQIEGKQIWWAIENTLLWTHWRNRKRMPVFRGKMGTDTGFVRAKNEILGL